MHLNEAQNIQFMNNPERLKAEVELKKALKDVRDIQTLSARTILVCMPQALGKLSVAYDNLTSIETRLEREIMEVGQ